MTAVDDDSQTERRRWLGALAGVLILHAAPLFIAAWWLGPILAPTPPEPAVIIDMAPPAAPPVPPSEQPPGPQQQKAEARRPVVRETPLPVPIATQPEVSLPVRQPETPQKAATTPAPLNSAPPSRTAPPATNAASGTPDWRGQVLARLDRVKRYPAAAEIRRQQGVPYIRFTIDREGRVLSTRLERSSGVASLDQEALSLPRRGQPFPHPPAEVAGDPIELVTPVEFFLAR